MNSLKLTTILQEGISDIAYHFTSVERLVSILKKNAFNLTFAPATPNDEVHNKGKLFFMSTTRSKSTGYVAGDVRITLDGRKLGHTFKVIPVEFWKLFLQKPEEFENITQYNLHRTNSEQEDRIISDDDEISDANTYIKDIHIVENTAYEQELSEVLFYADKYNIPVYIYTTFNDFLHARRGRIETSDSYGVKYNNDGESDDYVGIVTLHSGAVVAYNNKDNYKKIIEFIPDTYQKMFANISDEVNSEFDKLDVDSMRRRGSSLIHQIRSGSNKYDRFILKLIKQEMSKNKIKTFKEYFELKKISK